MRLVWGFPPEDIPPLFSAAEQIVGISCRLIIIVLHQGFLITGMRNYPAAWRYSRISGLMIFSSQGRSN
jgi:hypothetical protein